YISPPALSQLAAIPAFDCRAELDGHVARYRANRDLLITTLKKAGLTRFAPADGAFYLYVDVSSLTRDSEAFCRQMLAEIGVAATPGRDFDPARGRGRRRHRLRGPPRRHRRSRRSLRGMAAQAPAMSYDFLMFKPVGVLKSPDDLSEKPTAVIGSAAEIRQALSRLYP